MLGVYSNLYGMDNSAVVFNFYFEHYLVLLLFHFLKELGNSYSFLFFILRNQNIATILRYDCSLLGNASKSLHCISDNILGIKGKYLKKYEGTVE